MTLNLIIMGSTRGSSIQGLLDKINTGEIDAKVSLIVSDRENSPILNRAKNHNIKTYAKNLKNIDREQYDLKVIEQINKHNPDIILMVGYMRIVSERFTREYVGRLINIHPSLLPAHAGLMDLAVHQSVLDAGDSESGCTIHQVIHTVDSGKNVLQLKCIVENNDTAETLKKKVQTLETKAWIEVIKNWKKD